MRKTSLFICVMLCMVGLCSVLAGCQNEELDPTKSHLYVWNYNGGIGTEWLENAAAKFEAKYADTNFEPGTDKKGVKIHITRSKDLQLASVQGMAQSVFFGENVMFNDLAASGEILDITDIVRASLSDITDGKETGTIEDKIDPIERAALTARTKSASNPDGNYYALPHYDGIVGAIYDAALFHREELYLARKEDGSWNGGWTNIDSEKTVGPDGIAGTYDDGLPSSYEEFDKLCERMIQLTITPFIWSGHYAGTYAPWIGFSAWSAFAGKDAAMLTYNLGTGAGAGVEYNYVVGFNGLDYSDYPIPVTEKRTTSPKTAYETINSDARYYSICLMHKIFTNPSMYSDKINGAQSHLDAQTDFVYSDLEGSPVAMLIEGIWWYGEASGAIQRSAKEYPERGVDRDFRFMPLPVKGTGSVKEGEGRGRNTLGSAVSGYAFINANVKSEPWKEALAKKFLQFCYTDELLEDFSCITGVTKALDYEISQERMQTLPKVFQNNINIMRSSDIVRCSGDQDFFIYNQQFFEDEGAFFASKIGSKIYTNVYAAFYSNTNPPSAKDYFQGLIEFRGLQLWKSQFSNWIDFD